MTLLQIAEVSTQLAQKARNGELLPEDYNGGTFTVTNLGMLDSRQLYCHNKST